jgi:hypothetical protein
MNREESTDASDGEGDEESATTFRSDIRLAATPQPVYFSEVVTACAVARAQGGHTDLLLAGRGGAFPGWELHDLWICRARCPGVPRRARRAP